MTTRKIFAEIDKNDLIAISKPSNAIEYDPDDTCHKNKIRVLAEIIKDLTNDTEPDDEELDYDDDYIELYDNIHNLKQSLETLGLI